MTAFQFDESTTRQIRVEAGRILGKANRLFQDKELLALQRRLIKRAIARGLESWDAEQEAYAFVDAVAARMGELERQRAECAASAEVVSILLRKAS